MNRTDIKKLEKSDGVVWPIEKHAIKMRQREEKQRQNKLRIKHSNK